jgi:hypothetical protein
MRTHLLPGVPFIFSCGRCPQAEQPGTTAPAGHQQERSRRNGFVETRFLLMFKGGAQ